MNTNIPHAKTYRIETLAALYEREYVRQNAAALLAGNAQDYNEWEAHYNPED